MTASPLHIHMLKANPQCDGIRRQSPWEVMWVGPSCCDQHPQKTRKRERALGTSTQQEGGCQKIRKQPPSDTRSAGTSILGFSASKVLISICGLSHPIYSVWLLRTSVSCYMDSVCLTLCGPVDRSPAGSFVHGILQANILEWVAMPFYRGSSQHRD